MSAVPSRCRWLSRSVTFVTGLCGSAAGYAQGPTIDFELLDPATAAVPVGNGVVIGSLLGIIAAVFLLRRRAAPVGGAAVLVLALGGLLGGVGAHQASAVASKESRLPPNPFVVDDVNEALQGKTPAQALESLKGKTLEAPVKCPQDSLTLSNPFVGGVSQQLVSLSLFPAAYADDIVLIPPEAILAAIRLKALNRFETCLTVDLDASTCRAGTVLQPGESCTIAVSEQQLAN
jgi:hypothetical protein